MKLSDELITQLVKVTNDRPDRKTDVVVYGTIRDDGTRKYVQLDGSDVWTPVETAVEINADDRVTVAVRNHAATITGNITDPAIGTKTADGLRSSITQTAEEIRLEVENLNENLKSTISQTAGEIRSEVSAAVDGLNTSINNVNTNIQKDLGDAILALNKSIEEGDSGVREDLEEGISGINTNIGNINSEINDIQLDITNLDSRITQTAGEIRSEVSAEVKDINATITNVETGIRTDFNATSAELDSKITQTASSIRSEVSASITGINGDITNLDSKIAQNATSITTLVSNQDDFSEFKQTVEGFAFMNKGGTVKIGGGNLDLTGAITFTDLNSDVSGKIDTANTNASNAVDTANGANSTANSALNTANGASSTANSALSTANSANNKATNAVNVANEAYDYATSITIPDYIKSTYIDATTIKSPDIEGNDIRVYGTFQTMGATTNGGSPVTTGYMGAAQGLGSDDEITYGVALARTWDPDTQEVSNSYVIVTNGGVRLQYNDNSLIVSSQGIALKTPGYTSRGEKCKAYYYKDGVKSEIATVDSVATVTAVWG